MNTNNQNKAGLVPSQTSALSPSGVTSLVRRGRQDLIAKAEAEQWCNQGRALWRRQQYGEAVECFRHGLQLDPNHVELQFLLGAAYHQGNGLPERDHTQAALWYRRAAEQGLPAAQALLGMMYEWSWGVPQDYSQAAEWYRKAAEQGHAGAGYVLGCCYWVGRGVPRNYAQACAWFRKAADQGDASAANNLAVCYERGLGVPHDREQAVQWYGKAAELGSEAARAALAILSTK